MAVENRGPQLEAVVIALYITSMVTGALRFYTHGFILKRFFAEDYITIVALVGSLTPRGGMRLETAEDGKKSKAGN